MPRSARIDAADAVHHIMVRGIERKKIFESDEDRKHFLHRLGEVLQDTGTTCFAWSLMPNHFHLLCRTGPVPLSTVMRRLLTGYAVWFNRSRRRHGHLFQNRFKSILCQEEAYLLELVRYIHLNPLRAGLVRGLDELDSYDYSGHSTLMGKNKNPWQETEETLRYFSSRPASARKAYRSFVAAGIAQGRRPDLAGGGLIRSAGGWDSLKQKRREGVYQRSDERILGDSEFVTRVLARSKEQMNRRHVLRAAGMDLDRIAKHVSIITGLAPKDILSAGRQRPIVRARSLFCYWAVREMGVSMSGLANRFGISVVAVSKSVVRGREIAEQEGLRLVES